MPKLELRNKSLADLNQEYELQDVTFVDNDEGFAKANLRYPENNPEAATRAQENI